MPAPKGNQYAAKAPAERISGRGRVTIDLGPLKAEAQDACKNAESLTDLVRAAVHRELVRRSKLAPSRKD